MLCSHTMNFWTKLHCEPNQLVCELADMFVLENSQVFEPDIQHYRQSQKIKARDQFGLHFGPDSARSLTCCTFREDL